MFVSLRKKVTKLIDSAKSNFFSQRFKNSTFLSQTWKQIKALRDGKQKTSQELDVDINELKLKLAECQVPEVTTNTYRNSVP